MRVLLLLATLATACSSQSPPRPAAEPVPVDTEPAEPEPVEPEPADPDPADPDEPGTACDSDGDCVMTTFAGCCDCCGCTAPHAIHRRDLESQKSRCQRVRCNMSRCAAVTCAACPEEPPAGDAVCRDRRCVAR